MDSISSKSEVSEFSGGRGGGAEAPYYGGRGYMWPVMPIFELGRAIPVKSNVWKFWFRLVEPFKSYLNFLGGAETPYEGGYMWPAMPKFELGRANPVKSHVWKFSSDWLSLSRVIVSTNIFFRGGGG